MKSVNFLKNIFITAFGVNDLKPNPGSKRVHPISDGNGPSLRYNLQVVLENKDLILRFLH